MRKNYPSDISREQFEHISDLLKNARKRTRPRTVDLYQVFCGLLYLLKSGGQWRMLPSDFPDWHTVYAYYAKWREVDAQEISVLERALKKSSRTSAHQAGTKRQNQLRHR
jgi:transposase